MVAIHTQYTKYICGMKYTVADVTSGLAVSDTLIEQSIGLLKFTRLSQS